MKNGIYKKTVSLLSSTLSQNGGGTEIMSIVLKRCTVVSKCDRV
jgi:hypothetical protein